MSENEQEQQDKVERVREARARRTTIDPDAPVDVEVAADPEPEGDEQHDEHVEWTHVRCPRCGEIVAQTPNGNYRKHESVAGKVCQSTGQPVNGG